MILSSLVLSTSDFLNSASFFQGTGRYAIYIANYASGNVGPHALIEMDESASDLSQGVIALSNVAEQAGVNKFTGGCPHVDMAGGELSGCRNLASVRGRESKSVR